MNRDEKKRYATRMRVRRYRSVLNEIKRKKNVLPSVSDRNYPSTSTEYPVHQLHEQDYSEESTCSDVDDADKVEPHNENIENEPDESGEKNEVSDRASSEDNRDSGEMSIDENRMSDEESSDETSAGDGERSDENPARDGECDARNPDADGRNVQEENDEILALRKWAIDSRIEHTHLDLLLGILRRRLLPRLPKSSKTFLKTTSAVYEIEEFINDGGEVGGQFVYFGIVNHLVSCVNTDIHDENILYLQFNVDGLPLFKSSSQQLWPILCKVHFDPDVYEAFPVAIYTGTEKPRKVDKYFEKFIAEMTELLCEGIKINGRLFKIYIKCFVCDRPARSFAKCIKNHGGYYACERCTVPGERCDNRTVYVPTNCDTRTDETFRNQDQPEHHLGISPLTSILQLNMVNHFVLDFMHLCCLGIMKKFLDYWLNGHRRIKLSQHSKIQLSQCLLNLQSQVPQDFQRTTRSLIDIAKWKATEFRFFLLYLAPVVLKKVLSDELYKHFLLFHTACRILCSKDLASRFNEQAKVYLSKFVQLAEQLYGTHCQVLNMHSLIHLADDVETVGCSLSQVTAFPFENILGKMKKMVRSGRRPLSQIARRYHEVFFANIEKASVPPIVTILRKKCAQPYENTILKKLRYKGSILTNISPDNVVLLRNNQILTINTMYIPHDGDQNTIRIAGKLLAKEKPIYEFPCNSQTLNMWKVKKTDMRKTCVLQEVVSKMVCLQINDVSGGNKIYIMPLLHQ